MEEYEDNEPIEQLEPAQSSKRIRPPKGLKGLSNKLRKGAKNTAKKAAKAIVKGIKIIFSNPITAKIFLIVVLVILILAIFWFVLTDNTVKAAEDTADEYFSKSDAVSSEETKKYYENNASLLLTTSSDISNLSNMYFEEIKNESKVMYKLLSDTKKVGNYNISELSSYAELKYKNPYEYILNTEKINFNSVVWKKFVRGADQGDLALITDDETGLKYPNDANDKKELKDFANLLRPYLLTWIIPLTMFSGISTETVGGNHANFVYEIIENAKHDIEIHQHTLQTMTRHRTLDNYRQQSYTITAYERTNGDGTTEKAYVKSELVDNISEDVPLVSQTITLDSSFKDRILETKIDYQLVKAEMFDNIIQNRYSVQKYNDADVEGFVNYDSKMVVKTTDYTKYTGLESYKTLSSVPSSESGWVSSGSVSYTVKQGSYVTEQMKWEDKFKTEQAVTRRYDMADLNSYIETETILNAAAEDYEEKSKEYENKNILSSKEKSYYTDIFENEDELFNRIDLINAVNSKRSAKQQFTKSVSTNIGYTRKALATSYDLMERYLTKLANENSLRLKYGASVAENLEQIYDYTTSGMSYGFIWPVPLYIEKGYTKTEQISYYVDKPGTTKTTYTNHKGIDIRSSLESEEKVIVASKAGEVIQVVKNITGFVDGSYGNYVLLKHNDGYFTIYAHLKHNSVPQELVVGAQVSQGQELGLMGNTGMSFGAHLHFEIRKGEGTFKSAEVLEPDELFNEDCSPKGGGSSYAVMQQIVTKAKELAKLKNMLYRQSGRQIYYEVDKLNGITQTDCSGFVSSLYSSYMGINIATSSSSIKSDAEKGTLENGWTAVVGEYNGDTSVLQPGDILWFDGHVGVYVGNGKQIDQGGPCTHSNHSNSECDVNWKGPRESNVYTAYTHYIRYSKAGGSIDLTEVDNLRNDSELKEILSQINASGYQKEAIEYMAPYAIAVSRNYDVLPSVLIAQAGNEGGWQNIVNYKKAENGEKVSSLNSVFGITKSGEGSGWQDSGTEMSTSILRYATFLEENSRYSGRKAVIASGQSAEEMYKGVTNAIAQAGWCYSIYNDAGTLIQGQAAYNEYESRLNGTISKTKLWLLDRYAGKAK